MPLLREPVMVTWSTRRVSCVGCVPSTPLEKEEPGQVRDGVQRVAAAVDIDVRQAQGAAAEGADAGERRRLGLADVDALARRAHGEDATGVADGDGDRRADQHLGAGLDGERAGDVGADGHDVRALRRGPGLVDHRAARVLGRPQRRRAAPGERRIFTAAGAGVGRRDRVHLRVVAAARRAREKQRHRTQPKRASHELPPGGS
jgi:hypothetical protein